MQIGFGGDQSRGRQGIAKAAPGRGVPEVPAGAAFADPAGAVEEKIVRAEDLVLVQGKDHRQPLFLQGEEHRRRKVVIDPVDVGDIRLDLIDQGLDPAPGLPVVDHARGRLEAVDETEPGQLLVRFEIIDKVAAVGSGQIAWMVHGEGDDLVPPVLEQSGEVEIIALRAPLDVIELVDHQDLHRALPPS
ncbi:MAG: hypothetical protein BWY77_01397 [bacterium ADurb.Bin431]|nr:MAG: hypothetical protein BWY77_01397 [bacterium ADurb.Bin431]